MSAINEITEGIKVGTTAMLSAVEKATQTGTALSNLSHDVGIRVSSCVKGVEKLEHTSGTLTEVCSYVKSGAKALDKSASAFKISETENTES